MPTIILCIVMSAQFSIFPLPLPSVFCGVKIHTTCSRFRHINYYIFILMAFVAVKLHQKEFHPFWPIPPCWPWVGDAVFAHIQFCHSNPQCAWCHCLQQFCIRIYIYTSILVALAMGKLHQSRFNSF